MLDQQQQLQLKTQQMLEEKTLLLEKGSKKKVVADMDKLNLKTLQQNKKRTVNHFSMINSPTQPY